MYTLHMHIFARLAPICKAQLVLSRKFIKSALSVGHSLIPVLCRPQQPPTQRLGPRVRDRSRSEWQAGGRGDPRGAGGGPGQIRPLHGVGSVSSEGEF